MNSSLSNSRWLQVLSAGLAVIALSFIALTLVIAGYACVLAFQARGAPNQSAINAFAGGIGPRLMPVLEIVLAFVLPLAIGRRTGEGSAVQGLLIGVVAGGCGLVVAHLFGAHLSLTGLLIAAGIAGAGCLGGVCGQVWHGKR